MPILAMSAGTVTAVWGKAYIRLPGGGLKAVQVGDKVAGGERIFTDDNGIVQISPDKGAAVLVEATVAPAEVDKAIVAINEQDPAQVPAAGLSGLSEGGLQPGLRVERVLENVSPQSLDLNLNQAVPELALVSTVDQRALPDSTQASEPVTPPIEPPPEPVVLPTLSLTSNTAAIEGQPLDFTVRLSDPSATAVSVALSQLVATEHGSSATPGVDTVNQLSYLSGNGQWLALTGDLVFQPGVTTMQVRVSTVNDTQVESTEYIRLQATVTSGNTANVGQAAEAAIIDNDSDPNFDPITGLPVGALGVFPWQLGTGVSAVPASGPVTVGGAALDLRDVLHDENVPGGAVASSPAVAQPAVSGQASHIDAHGLDLNGPAAQVIARLVDQGKQLVDHL